MTAKEDVRQYTTSEVSCFMDEDPWVRASAYTAQVAKLEAEVAEQGRNACALFDEAYRLRGELIAAEAALAAATQRAEAAEKERDSFIDKAAYNMRLYMDLLMQVVHVVPGESRHDSAKRIIRQHEEPSRGPEKAALAAREVGK